MKMTTLCYLKSNGKYLMLHRTKKKNDENGGKWIGIGGKFEDGESPEECVKREFKEETGLEITSYALKGIITFISDIYETEYMYLFCADKFKGELLSCDEGELKWVDCGDVTNLNIWEGDRIFLDLMQNHRFFTLRLEYRGDSLIKHDEKIYY